MAGTSVHPSNGNKKGLDPEGVHTARVRVMAAGTEQPVVKEAAEMLRASLRTCLSF